MHLAGALAPLLAAAADADAIRERARQILDGGRYQTELPGPLRVASLDLPLGPLEILARILLWTVLLVMAVLAVAWLVGRLRGLVPDARAPAGPARGAEEVGHPQLGAAEALAAQGRFGEAVHVLLLDTLEALSRRARLAPSLTSREIVARVPLPDRARDALSGLVSAVEVSWFGGQQPGEAEYRLCLDRFHAFLDATRSAA
jgi:hypothetical protein